MRLARTYKSLLLPLLALLTEAQDLAEAPALPGALLPKEAVLASAYQLFPSEEFDLGGKQASFEPSQQHAGFYTIAVSNSTELVDLQEEWSVISKPVKTDIGAGFLYNGEEHSAVVIHQGGYLTFNGSTSNGELDCLNATTFEGQDIIVALCTAKMLTLVRYTHLDDRLIVQWALPYDDCSIDGSMSPSPAGSVLLAASTLIMAEAQLMFSGEIFLGWNAPLACQTAVGLGISGGDSEELAFSDLPASVMPPPPDCNSFSVNGLGQAYSCEERKAILTPASLASVVLFAGKKTLQQQVLTVTNAAGLRGSVVGGPAQAPALAPAPESPIGMSRSARGLKQLPSGFTAGGLAALQQVQQGIINALRTIEPELAPELAAYNSTLNATVSTLLLPVAEAPSPLLLPLLPVQEPSDKRAGAAPSSESGRSKAPAPAVSPSAVEAPPPTSLRHLLQGEGKAPSLPTLPAVAASSLAPTPSPVLAPMSVEAASGVIAAVGIKETPKTVAVAEKLVFIPAPACKQPRQAGPCEEPSPRWYFDARSNQCRQFIYGGCLGNLNNFASQISCQQACIAGTAAPKEAASTGQISIPAPSDLVFLATALTTKSWVTLDATSGILGAGASAALHLTYNASGLDPGQYVQSITLNSNDPANMTARLQASLLLFCDRFNTARNPQPSAPQVKYVTLTGTAPQWAVAADAQAVDPLVYFELEVIFADPVATLRASNLAIEADEEPATIVSITPLEESRGFGAMCSAWRVRGTCLLPADYADNDDGTLFVASIHSTVTAWGDSIPDVSSNKTLYNSLPQCTMYAQGMTFGGDLGLVVASSLGKARAVLVCTVPMQGLCSHCIRPVHTQSSASVETTFTGLAPGKQSQYDIEIGWPAGQYFGGINITISCNATDDNGRPLAAVQPLPFAVVASPQLNPPTAIVEPPAAAQYPPGLNPYVEGPQVPAISIGAPSLSPKRM